jgi:tetratricopeptide (TPR) repeat protein
MRSVVLVAVLASMFLAGQSLAVPAQTPVSAVQLLAWLAGGLTPAELRYELQHRGVSFAVDDAYLQSLSDAGADASVVEILKAAHPADPSAAMPVETSRVLELLAKAAREAHIKKCEAAKQHISSALRTTPNDANLHFALAFMLGQKEQWGDAADELVQAIRLDPDFPYAHGLLAYVDYRLNDTTGAESEARIMISTRPEDPVGYKDLGLALDAKNDFTGALSAYNHALILQPEYADAYYDIGVLMSRRQQWDQAIEAYQKSLELDPNRWKGFYNLGIAYSHSGHSAEAIEAYQKAKRLAPEELTIRQNLGAEYCNHGQHEQAIVEFSELLQIDPDWNMARLCLYKSLMAVGRVQEASQVQQEYRTREGYADAR